MFPTKFDLNTEAHDDTMPESPNNETEMRIACRYVMIGNYCFTPKSKVHISSEGVSIPVPKLSPPGEDTTVHIPLKSIVNVLTHTEHNRVAAILLYTEAKTGVRVRGELGMRREAGPYFSPSSPEEVYKRVALLPATLARRRAAALRTLFGLVLDAPSPGPGDCRLRGLPLQHGTPESERASPERRVSPARCTNDTGPESPHKDSASSSSSVIFPPSPAPISLSSPSSVHSRQSSRSSRKRKSRSKKSKNKKMKYVLVKNPEPNCVDAFLAGVAPILKSLNPVLLNLAKSEIITAALKYERKMLTDNCIGNGGHSPNQLFPD